MAVAIAKKNIENPTITGNRQEIEYLNLLSLISLVNSNKLSDSKKSEIKHKVGVSKSFYDKGDIDTAYTLLKIEYDELASVISDVSLKDIFVEKIDNFNKQLKENKAFKLNILFFIALSLCVMSYPNVQKKASLNNIESKVVIKNIDKPVEIANPAIVLPPIDLNQIPPSTSLKDIPVKEIPLQPNLLNEIKSPTLDNKNMEMGTNITTQVSPKEKLSEYKQVADNIKK